ncbi:MAG: hypothetical protein VXX56_00805 [Pseudomonadota bacterium]|nr:hypothetical protein [Pseudomonadota bacterium]
MTPKRFEVIIRGATEIWDVECKIEFMDSRSGCLLRMTEHKVSISHEVTSFGNVWRIIELDGRERVHPSLGSMLNSLSRILRPNQPNARVIFAR